MPSLTEQYRPTSFGAVVGQDKAVSRLRALERRGFGGRALLFTGASGTGKTTLARIVAGQVAHPLAVEEIDPSDLTADRLRTIGAQLQGSGTIFQPSGRAWIVNECHGLTARQVRELLTILEPDGGIPGWAVFIFTTTSEGAIRFDGLDDGSPFLSRLMRFDLNRRPGAEVLAEYVRGIAVREGLDGASPERYLRLVRDCKNNVREALTRVEAGEMLAG